MVKAQNPHLINVQNGSYFFYKIIKYKSKRHTIIGILSAGSNLIQIRTVQRHPAISHVLVQHPVLNTSTCPRITSSHAWPWPAAKLEVKERAQWPSARAASCAPRNRVKCSSQRDWHMSTEILGADRPRTKYIFGVCVQKAHCCNVTSTSRVWPSRPSKGVPDLPRTQAQSQQF